MLHTLRFLVLTWSPLRVEQPAAAQGGLDNLSRRRRPGGLILPVPRAEAPAVLRNRDLGLEAVRAPTALGS